MELCYHLPEMILGILSRLLSLYTYTYIHSFINTCIHIFTYTYIYIQIDRYYTTPWTHHPNIITNTARIDAALPTIKYALDNGAKSVVPVRGAGLLKDRPGLPESQVRPGGSFCRPRAPGPRTGPGRAEGGRASPFSCGLLGMEGDISTVVEIWIYVYT